MQQRRRPGTRQVQRPGPPLVGPGQRVPPLHEINPLRLDWIDALASLRGKRCWTSAAAAASWPSHGARGATGDGHRPGRQAAGRGAAARLESGSRTSTTARSLPKRWPPSSPAASTSSPAWRCSSMCPTRRRSCRPAHAGQAGRLGVLLHLNRNPKAFLFAIVGAEYVLKLLPKGTHEYAALHPPQRTGALVPRCRPGSVWQTRAWTYNPLTKRYGCRPTPASTTCWPAAGGADAAIRRRAVRPGRHPGRQRPDLAGDPWRGRGLGAWSALGLVSGRETMPT
jgi:2-polyprenyl-6-hydroxyphenyl methylase/3-demethylubiquinone-9 3-methyltransferase